MKSSHTPVLLQRLVYSQKWVWGVVVLSILVCVVIAWLHFQEEQRLNRTIKALDTFRQARIDLTSGILHLALADDPALPFNREQGLALLEQAVTSFDKAVTGLNQSGLSVSQFQAEAQAFRYRLTEWDAATATAVDKTELRIASDRLETQADHLDMETRAHLLTLARQHESVFSWALGGAAILLAGICGVVFWAERGKQAAEAERRQTETGLRESEEKYRTLMEAMADGMFVAQDYHFVFANPALPAMLGYTPQAFSGLPFEAVIAPEFLPVWTERYTQRITQSIEPLKHYEVRFLCNGGQASLWVELRANRIEYQGRPAVLGIIRDISERKQTEEALRESEERLRLALTAANQGLYDLNIQTGETQVSPEYATMLGYDPDTFHETNAAWTERLHPDDRQPVADNYRAYVAGEVPVYAVEFRQRTCSGDWKWILSLGKIVAWDSEGRPLRMMGTHTDINARKQAEAALRESEERLAFALEVSQMGSWEFNLVDHTAYRSLQHARIFGYETPEQAWTFEIFLEHIIPEDRAEVERTIGQAIAAQNNWSIECRIRRCDGEIRWIWVVGHFRNNLAESSKMVGGIVLDITERKQAEAALRESEARYRLIAANTDDVIWLLSLTTGKFTYVSPSVQKLRGYTPEEVLEQTMAEALTPESMAQVSDSLPGRLERFYAGDPTAVAQTDEVDQPHKDGSIVQTEVVTTLLADDQGQATEILGVTRDITERKQAEQSLQESERRYRELVQNANSAIIRWNRNGDIVFFNEFAQSFFGYRPDQVIGQKVNILVPATESTGGDLSMLVENILAHPEQFVNYDNENVCRDGRRVWMAWTNKPIYENGRVEEILAIGMDITARKQAEEKLRDSEEWLRLAYDAAELGIWRHDIAANIFSFDARARQHYGLEAADIAAAEVITHIHPEDQARLLQEIAATLDPASSGRYATEYRVVHPDGAVHWLAVQARVIFEGKGSARHPVWGYGTSQDITARKQAEEKLRELQNMLSTAESVAGLGSWKWDLQTQKVSWSDEMFNLFGVDRANFDGDVGRVIASRIHPDDMEAVNESNRSVLETGQPIPLEYRIVLPDGRQRYVWAEGALIHDLSGRPVVLTGYVQDITARKQVEAQIQAQARWMQTLADTSRTFAEVGTDFQTVLKLAAHLIADHLNAACVARLLSEDGQWLETAIVYDQDPAALEVAETVIRNDTRYHIINDASNPAVRAVRNGQSLLLPAIDREQLRPFYPPEVWAVLKPYCPRSALIVPLRVQKQVLGVFSFSRYRPEQPPFNADDLHLVQDLADRAALALSNARLFEQVQDELAERKRAEEQIRRAAAELARSNADLEQFAYVASHDLQEPLRAVAGMLTLLQQRYQSQLDARANEFIGHAVDGATRMQTLINDLLTFSRVGTRGQPFQPINCAEVLTTVRANLAVAIKESQASLTYDTLPEVVADRTQLIQLFQNLIANAIKFRGNNTPVIHIGAQQKNNAWVFAVSDNGIGMEGQYLERIFGVFQRLHTRREYPGTGIGLALCKKIVERHGGHIWVESEPGQGSTFYFTLPARNQ